MPFIVTKVGTLIPIPSAALTKGGDPVPYLPQPVPRSGVGAYYYYYGTNPNTNNSKTQPTTNNEHANSPKPMPPTANSKRKVDRQKPDIKTSSHRSVMK